MKLFRFNITQKFVGYLMFLSIIPLLVVSTIAYRNSFNLLQAKSQRSTSQLIGNQKDYLELRLGQLENLLTNVAGVDEIRQVLNDLPAQTNAYSNLSTQARIGYVLNSYISLLPGLVSIDIFTISGVHYHVGDTLDIEHVRNDVKERLFQTALKTPDAISWTGVVDNVNETSTESKVITASKVLYRYDNTTLVQTPTAFVLINYTINELYSHFSQINFDEGAYMLIIDRQGNIIYSPNRTQLGTVVTSELRQRVTANEGVLNNVLIDNVPMLITYKTSELTGWKIFSLVSLSTFNAQASAIGGTLFLVLFVSFVVVGLVALVYSRNLVQPIREITERFKQLGTVPADQQQRMIAHTSDEIGELVRWFNEFLDSLVAKQKTEIALLDRIQFEKLIAETSTEFIDVSAAAIQPVIKKTLQQISEFSQVERSYVIIFSDKPMASSAITEYYEWHKVGFDEADVLPWGNLPWLSLAMAELKPLYVSDIFELPTEAQTEKKVFMERGVRSMIFVPMVSGEQLTGVVGFEALSKPYEWDKETIALLSLVGQIIITSLERISAEEEREQFIKQLRESLLFKDQFLATISHELRTPLNAIQGYAGLILQEDTLTEDITYMSTRILSNSERLLELINDVLDISRINAQRVEIVARPIALPKMIQSWYNDFKTQAETKNLEFELYLDPELPENILGDEARLTQVAANLIQNALKFTDKGKVSLLAKMSVSGWSFAVSDSGIGIPEIWQHLIFDEFRQVDSSSKRKHGGAGLGLAIVKKLCILMSGTITVTSKPGEGSTFTVGFPMEIKEPITKEYVGVV